MALAIRIVIIVVVIALIILVLRSKLKDGLRVLLIVLFIVVGVLASLFPIERWFIRASTPEEAFAQTVSSGEIMDVIHGKNSCMIYYSTGENSSSVCFFEIENGEYRPIDMIDVNVVSAHREDLNLIRIVQLPNTKEHYLLGILHSPTHVLEMQDEYSTEFYINEVYRIANDSSYDVFAYLPEYSGDYQVAINGASIPLPLMLDQNLSIFNFTL